MLTHFSAPADRNFQTFKVYKSFAIAGRSFSHSGHQGGRSGQRVPNGGKPLTDPSTLVPPPVSERRGDELLEEDPETGHLLDQAYMVAVSLGWG